MLFASSVCVIDGKETAHYSPLLCFMVMSKKGIDVKGCNQRLSSTDVPCPSCGKEFIERKDIPRSCCISSSGIEYFDE